MKSNHVIGDDVILWFYFNNAGAKFESCLHLWQLNVIIIPIL